MSSDPARPRTPLVALVLPVAAIMLLFALGLQAAPAFARGLTRGFADDVWFDPPADGISQHTWVKKTVGTGAKRVMVEVDWAALEPHRPSGAANLRNPAAPQFDFSYLDQRVKEFQHTDLQPVMLVTDAPRWAEGKGGTAAEYATGGYRPNARALGNLAAAMARRYSGSYPDPTNRHRKLPKVRYFQAWAEAAFNVRLSPQWTRSHGHWVNTGASLYRQLLNSFYAGIKAGDRGAQVLFSGIASFGDKPGGQRTHPITFLEHVLCLNGRLRRQCSAKAHFDILAADPYEVGAPTQHAYSRLDASVPDLGRFTRIVNAAVRAHTVVPGRHKPLWVTEFGYDSRPPNPHAVSTATQARWLQQAFYIFWKEHVSTVFWYLIRDQVPPYSVNYFSGVYFRNGRPKPSLTAYHFPLVVMAVDRKHAQIWGIAQSRGKVKVQRRVHGHWRTIARFRRRGGAVFSRKISRKLRGRYRAKVGRHTSLVWKY